MLVGLRRRGAGARRRAARARQRGLRAPAQGARPARSRWRPGRQPESATARARRWRRSACPPTRAPRRSPPAQWRALYAGARCDALSCARAPGKVNLCLFVGAPARRRAAPARLGRPAARRSPTSSTLEPARRRRDEVICPGVEGPNLAARALAALPRGDRLGRAAAAAHDRQADPGRGRHGRRLRRRRRRAAARRRTPPGRRPRPAPSSRSRLGADVPSQLAPGRGADDGRRRARRAARRPGRRSACVSSPRRRLSHADVYREPTASASPRRATSSTAGSGQVPGAARAARARRAPAPQRPRGAARSLCPPIDAALAPPRGRRGARAGLRLRPDRRSACSRRGRARHARAPPTRSPRLPARRRRRAGRPRVARPRRHEVHLARGRRRARDLLVSSAGATHSRARSRSACSRRPARS